VNGPDGYMKYEWYNQDYSQLIDSGQHIAFQPISTTPQKYNLILTPFPSVSACPDTIKTIDLANNNIDKIDTTCVLPNTPIVLNGNIHGGAGNVTYNWTESKALNTLSCTDCAVPTATTPTSNYYKVKVQDTSGCFRTEIMSVGVNENTLDVIDDFVQCSPGYMQLDANAYGPLPLTPVQCGLDTGKACTTPDSIVLRSMYRQPFEGIADTSSFNNPFASQYTSAHMQFLVKKEDLWAVGMRYGKLTSLGFDVV